jgi:hypothetical protein
LVFLALDFPTVSLGDVFAGVFVGLRPAIFGFPRRASADAFVLCRAEISREVFRFADLEADTVADLSWNGLEWLKS